MNSADLAERLIELTKSWDVAGALLGFKGTDIFQVVLTCVGEEPHQRSKSLNEVSAEISTFMDNDYIPIGFIAWTEYAPKQAKLMAQVLPDVSQDPWAQGVFAASLAAMMSNLAANGVIVDIEQ